MQATRYPPLSPLMIKSRTSRKSSSIQSTARIVRAIFKWLRQNTFLSTKWKQKTWWRILTDGRAWSCAHSNAHGLAQNEPDFRALCPLLVTWLCHIYSSNKTSKTCTMAYFTLFTTVALLIAIQCSTVFTSITCKYPQQGKNSNGKHIAHQLVLI